MCSNKLVRRFGLTVRTWFRVITCLFGWLVLAATSARRHAQQSGHTEPNHGSDTDGLASQVNAVGFAAILRF